MLVRETVHSRPTTVSFYFDPICPWTWITSRWLAEVAEREKLTVQWRSLSLAQLNGGVENMPEQYQEPGRFSMRALRVIEAIRAAGMEDRVGRFYTELGTQLHLQNESPSTEMLRQAADVAGVREYLGAAGDPYWDGAVSESTSEAVSLAGPDTGSPVLRLGTESWGLHGPIVSPAPRGEAALELWNALVTLTRVPGFYEVKHGRTGAPHVQPAGIEVEEVMR